MKLIVLKSCVGLASMIIFLVVAFITKDAIDSTIFASISIIAGTFTSHNLSTQNQTKNEYNKNINTY